MGIIVLMEVFCLSLLNQCPDSLGKGTVELTSVRRYKKQPKLGNTEGMLFSINLVQSNFAVVQRTVVNFPFEEINREIGKFSMNT